MDFFFYAAIITLIVGGILLADFVVGARKVQYLNEIQPTALSHQPKVSVIIPACNEEASIRAALQSVMAIDYGPLEIIVVNDRSTDATGAILDAMAERHPRLQVIHLKELPPQWLGKCH